ncbi:DUF2867 domain-containing protein [Zunongwangia sp. F260]|uniref:DUF2867 domain-containing protein n=1 Tax=Autumnicola lenta TaxID=3075593 RepID=A0ABU3CMC9_9FLAO|nr:DUF2867 domain-containing protein [Zunongwangia sp. F260]MDT0647125.1 DUF2867 domain-containing protein [Zunongwangia sp. F260]
MKSSKTTLPENSLLNSSHKKYDYVDSFQAVLYDAQNNFTSVDVGKAFFSAGPKWVENLFDVRNKIVSLFGFKTSGELKDRGKQLQNFRCEPGEQLGLFKVFDKNENEVILGEDDKHLNFRISLFLEQHQNSIQKKNLIISTTVEFNNGFGRLYFLPVRPFHKLIVPAILKGIIEDLEKQKEQANSNTSNPIVVK